MDNERYINIYQKLIIFQKEEIKNIKEKIKENKKRIKENKKYIRYLKKRDREF